MTFTNKLTEIQSSLLRFSHGVFFPAHFGTYFLLILISNFSPSCQSAATAGADSVTANEVRQSRNETALFQAKENIEKFRKGNAQVKVLDARGNPVKQVRVGIKQISHDFKFGCYLKIDDLAPEKLPEYERHFAKLFNYGVVGTYWDFVENKQGIENWLWFERETALGEKLGLRMQGAPVVWGTNKGGTPAWLPQSRSELLPILERRVKSAVTKNENRVGDWEIVNEPLAPKPDLFAQRIGDDYIESAFSWARQAAPAKRLLINEYGIFGAVGTHNYNRDKYLDLLKNLAEKKVPFDVIGIQAHASGEWYEPANVAEQLERYATLGKPIQITEFSAQIFNYDDRTTPINISGTYRSGIWNAEKQAEFYREFYTVAFGNRQVEAIVSWGLDDERAWLPGIGLIDTRGNTKPNYKTLDQLINNEWRTNLSLNIGANDTAKFRGFYGSYEVEVSARGRRTKTKFELKKDGRNEWVLQL